MFSPVVGAEAPLVYAALESAAFIRDIAYL
jgi:hypothetical protein